MMHYFYILLCFDNTYYCGYAVDLKKRLLEHNSGKSRGAKYTAPRRPVQLVYREAFLTKSSAMKREAEVKTWSRKEKIKLINNNYSTLSTV